MIIQIRYSYLRGPKSIMEKFYSGNAVRRCLGTYGNANTAHEALRWILEEGPKIAGFRYLGMEAYDTDRIPAWPARHKDNGDTDASIVGFNY